jgi:hypothetical protein
MTLAGWSPKNALVRNTPEERRALLQRVLWSRPIEKSARIRDLLTYVCERTFEEPAVEIHEQEIGHRVFGRSADYDTTVDNVVRVTVSQARKKLEQYFAADGAAEPILLEIPKGQYTPVFRERNALAPEVETPEPAAPRSLAVPILAGLVVLLAAVCVLLGLRLRTQEQAGRTALDANPNLRGLWSQLLPHSGAGRTDIVIADSSLSLFQELLDRPLTLAEYLNPDQWMPASQFAADPQLQSFAHKAAQRRFTSLASVTAVYRIGQLAGRDQSRMSFFSARDFNIREMKSDNVVLLGSSRANPWLELIEDRLDFRFGYDQQSRYAYFENRAPRPGEEKTYRTSSNVSYCQIAFLPNLGRTGNLLVIGGTEVEGTEGGSEFVTTESSLAQLRAVTPLSRDGRFPYFEVLLKSNRVGGAVPAFHVVAVRTPKL